MLLDHARDVIARIEAAEEALTRGGGRLFSDMEAEILDQMHRQVEVAEHAGLRGVRWETNHPGFFRYLEELVVNEFALGAKQGKIRVEVKHVQ